MSSYPDDLQALIERFLEQLRFADEPQVAGLEEAMRYSLMAGGKRIRPVLTMATARALAVDVESVLPTAAAIELIHTYSLIHDDLPAMDNDDLRRGKPTCHIAFGENVAILAGDGLFAEAYRLILEKQYGSPEKVLAVLHELACATGANGMVGGQYLDVAGSSGGDCVDLRHLHELKTGRLIAGAVNCALLLSEMDESARIPFGRFAVEVGVLFQIVDDILDVTGTEEALGKRPGSDSRLGKRTYVSKFGLERARELAAESYEATRGTIEEVARLSPGSTKDLKQIARYIYTRTS